MTFKKKLNWTGHNPGYTYKEADFQSSKSDTGKTYNCLASALPTGTVVGINKQGEALAGLYDLVNTALSPDQNQNKIGKKAGSNQTLFYTFCQELQKILSPICNNHNHIQESQIGCSSTTYTVSADADAHPGSAPPLAVATPVNDSTATDASNIDKAPIKAATP